MCRLTSRKAVTPFAYTLLTLINSITEAATSRHFPRLAVVRRRQDKPCLLCHGTRLESDGEGRKRQSAGTRRGVVRVPARSTPRRGCPLTQRSCSGLVPDRVLT